MKRAKVVVHKLTNAEVKRPCCSHDSIKQKAAAEDMVHAAVPKSENPLIIKMIKNEGPDNELEEISVKEPIDWHQESQDQMKAASFALTLKKEVDDACAEVRTEQVEDESREDSSGACNTRAVHQRSASASQGSPGSLPSDMSDSGSGFEANAPDTLKSVRFLCAHCDYSNTRKDELELHLWDEHRLAFDFKCLSSSYSSLHSNKSKLRLEVKDNERSILKLGPCSGKQPMKEFKKAKQEVSKLYRCELCGYCTAENSCFKQHQAVKHELKCELCDYNALDPSALKTHQACKHKLGNLLKCALCNYSTCYSSKLKLHQAGKHKVGKQLKCELCDYSTCVTDYLKRHQARKHKLGNQLKCELCDYSTFYTSDLKRHQACKHKLGNLLKCELCNYSTDSNSKMKRHQACKHQLGNLLKCELCDYSTCYTSKLKLHQARKHKIWNRLKCELCDYSTFYTGVIKRHRARKHKLGNRLKCELCDYSTFYTGVMKLHQASKHKLGNLLKCELCDYSTGSSRNLKLHRDRKHNLERNC